MAEPGLHFLSLAEVAKRFGISVRTLQRRIEESGIAVARPSRSYRFTEADVNTLFEWMRRRSRASRQDGDEADRPSSGGRSVDEMLRSLRRRETRRIIADVRRSWSDVSPDRRKR
jgi:excisionase family DNA binding protein